MYDDDGGWVVLAIRDLGASLACEGREKTPQKPLTVGRKWLLVFSHQRVLLLGWKLPKISVRYSYICWPIYVRYFTCVSNESRKTIYLYVQNRRIFERTVSRRLEFSFDMGLKTHELHTLSLVIGITYVFVSKNSKNGETVKYTCFCSLIFARTWTFRRTNGLCFSPSLFPPLFPFSPPLSTPCSPFSNYSVDSNYNDTQRKSKSLLVFGTGKRNVHKRTQKTKRNEKWGSNVKST